MISSEIVEDLPFGKGVTQSLKIFTPEFKSKSLTMIGISFVLVLLVVSVIIVIRRFGVKRGQIVLKRRSWKAYIN